MKRNDFLRGLGLAGLGSLLPWKKANAAGKPALPPLPGGGGCWLTPAETEGPFYFNAGLVRQDITEGYPGAPLYMTINVIDIDCNPIPNVLVDIWHCTAGGVYSGYPGQVGGLDTTGLTFLRGIQMSDANGQVQFTSIYPGWYPGRATHVHFKVRITSLTYVTSQWCFPDGTNNSVHASAPYTGTNPTTNAGDGIFGSALPLHEVMDIVPDGLGAYNGTFTVGIAGATGIEHLDPVTGGQFTLHQNAPNPVSESTVIPFTLAAPARVNIELFDPMGRRVVELVNAPLAAGEHSVNWDRSANGVRVPTGNYLFQLTTENSAGIFRQSKVLTVED